MMIFSFRVFFFSFFSCPRHHTFSDKKKRNASLLFLPLWILFFIETCSECKIIKKKK